jgi:hypothetical protein
LLSHSAWMYVSNGRDEQGSLRQMDATNLVAAALVA